VDIAGIDLAMEPHIVKGDILARVVRTLMAVVGTLKVVRNLKVVKEDILAKVAHNLEVAEVDTLVRVGRILKAVKDILKVDHIP
jgi:hypothetical protein